MGDPLESALNAFAITFEGRLRPTATNQHAGSLTPGIDSPTPRLVLLHVGDEYGWSWEDVHNRSDALGPRLAHPCRLRSGHGWSLQGRRAFGVGAVRREVIFCAAEDLPGGVSHLIRDG